MESKKIPKDFCPLTGNPVRLFQVSVILQYINTTINSLILCYFSFSPIDSTFHSYQLTNGCHCNSFRWFSRYKESGLYFFRKENMMRVNDLKRRFSKMYMNESWYQERTCVMCRSLGFFIALNLCLVDSASLNIFGNSNSK